MYQKPIKAPPTLKTPPFPSQIPPQPSKETLHFLQFKQEFEDLKRFVRSSLLSLRKELENVLYSCLLNLLRLGLDRRLSAEDQNDRYRILRLILDSTKNIFLNPRLLRDCQSLISSINTEAFPQGFSEFLEKTIGNGKSNVFLSQFSHECLFAFLEFEKLPTIQNALPTFLTIKVCKDPTSEANYKGELLRLSNNEDLEKMSIGNVQTILNKADIDLYQALDNINKKRFSIQKKAPNSLPNIEPLGLGEILKGIASPNHENESHLPMPEMKLSSRVNFCFNYLERTALNEKNPPSILQVTLTDSQENITCFDIGLNGNVLLCGNLDSSINLFLLNPDFLLDCGLPNEELPSIKKEDKEQNEHCYYSHKFLGHTSAITSLSLQYDELYFLSASVDSTIRLWCIRTRTCLAVYQAHLNTVWKIKFNPKGYYFASGSSDCTAKLWTLDRVSPVRLFIGHIADVTLVDFLVNCLFLVSSGLDNRIIFWEIASGTKVRVLFHYQETVTSLTISPSGLYMVSGSEEGSLIFWDLTRFIRVNCWELEAKDQKTGTEKRNKINFICYAGDESYLLVGSRRKIGLYLVKTLKEKKDLDVYKDLKEEEAIEKEEDGIEGQYYDNQGQDFFMSARFHEKNNILLISKSLL